MQNKPFQLTRYWSAKTLQNRFVLKSGCDDTWVSVIGWPTVKSIGTLCLMGWQFTGYLTILKVEARLKDKNKIKQSVHFSKKCCLVRRVKGPPFVKLGSSVISKDHNTSWLRVGVAWIEHSGWERLLLKWITKFDKKAYPCCQLPSFYFRWQCLSQELSLLLSASIPLC